jgi:hypothetical protein
MVKLQKRVKFQKRSKRYSKKKGGMFENENTRVVNAAMEGNMPINNCPPCPAVNAKEEGPGLMGKINDFNNSLKTGPPAFLADVKTNLSTKIDNQKDKLSGFLTGILKTQPVAVPAPVVPVQAQVPAVMQVQAPVAEGGRRRRHKRRTMKGKKSKKSKKGKKTKKRTMRR